ncbi:MAG: metallophosphoesterase [Methanosarcina sp.]
MKKLLLQIFLIFSFFVSISAVMINSLQTDNINDGPYIFINGNSFLAKWIDNGSLFRRKLKFKNFDKFKKKFNLKFTFSDLTEIHDLRPDQNQAFTGIDSICAISDIHGEFRSYTALLKSQGILDKDLNWNFGTGHLIILGDYFDRGDKVTELLWHLFGLEKQAEKAGGRVHLLLGNHEMMLFSNDTRYTNEKYLRVLETMGIGYNDMYSMQTVLGRWLRSKPVMVSLNNCLFVHGGISVALLHKNLSADEINALFSQLTLGEQILNEKAFNDLLFLTERNGPLWYRGFFTDADFSEASADSILAFYGTDHIIVGHTSDNEMKSLFNNKILCIDAGLGDDEPGAVLIWKNNVFLKGTADGKRMSF